MPCLLQLDWKSLLFGSEDWSFLLEILLRTFVMFVTITISLRVLGKRGVGQLSVFELGVIIGLGSAAGDPMFYKDVGLLPGIVVFAAVISLYKLLTVLINRSSHVERFLEGSPATIVDDGCFLVKEFEKEPIARDELLSELRLRSVSHLGQVRQAIIETNGEVSVFFFEDDEVKPGLPILPQLRMHPLTASTEEGVYACAYCGQVDTIAPTPRHNCGCCSKPEWLKALTSKRVS